MRLLTVEDESDPIVFLAIYYIFCRYVRSSEYRMSPISAFEKEMKYV